MTDSSRDFNLSRRTLLKTGFSSFAAAGLCRVGFAQGRGRGGMNMPPVVPDADNPAIEYAPELCQRCGECRLTCRSVQTVKGYPNVENNSEVCVYCGQCVVYCPENALTERFDFERVVPVLRDKNYIPIAAVAPSVPVSVGEMYRFPVGTDMTRPLLDGLKKIGFAYVLDTSCAADLTIMEESAELIRRLDDSANGPLPLLTSCCPAWVRFVELFYPRLIPNLSSAKSPLMMLGALIKTSFAERRELDPKKIVSVALSPCTAKKSEITLGCGGSAGRLLGEGAMRDLDYALTTREAAYLLHQCGERLDDPSAVPNERGAFDSFADDASGAGTRFGQTGGVAESLLRTAYSTLHGSPAPDDFLQLGEIRGMKSVRTFQVDFKTRKLSAAVVHGLGNAREFLDRMKDDGLKFDVVEVMACRGGCIGGGGQPLTPAASRDVLRQERMAGLLRRSEGREILTADQNPDVRKLYQNFFTEPLSPRALALLHRR